MQVQLEQHELVLRLFKDDDTLIVKFLSLPLVQETCALHNLPLNIFHSMLKAFLATISLEDIKKADSDLTAILMPTVGGVQ